MLVEIPKLIRTLLNFHQQFWKKSDFYLKNQKIGFFKI